MQIHILKKKNTLSKKNSEIDADFYWKIILYATCALIVLSAFFGYYLFSDVNKTADFSTEAALAQVGKVNKDRLDSVLQYFTDRENKSQTILSAPSPVIDPSQ